MSTVINKTITNASTLTPDQMSLITRNTQSFMTRFEQDNRGNKISLELLQGLGMTLNILINDVMEEVQALALEDSQKGQ